MVNMDNSVCHNARKNAEELRGNRIQRAAHQSYSSDLSPCDFWVFGLFKEKLKEHELSTAEQIIEAITAICGSVTFDELQNVSA
jgi:hypothetical protein